MQRYIYVKSSHTDTLENVCRYSAKVYKIGSEIPYDMVGLDSIDDEYHYAK